MSIYVLCPIAEMEIEFDSIAAARNFYSSLDMHPEHKLERGELFKEFEHRSAYVVFCGTIDGALQEAREYARRGVPVSIAMHEAWNEGEKRKVTTGKYTLSIPVLVPIYEKDEEYLYEIELERKERLYLSQRVN